MLLQIISHTPIYVWFVLALLIHRGVKASKDRELPFWAVMVVPLIVAPLTVADLVGKFGAAPLTFAAWSAAAAVIAGATFGLMAPRLAAGTQPGKVLVRGSWMMLSLMMAIFITKYAAAVLLAVSPALHHNASFIAIVCAMYGAFNGVFLGRMGRDIATISRLRAGAPALAAA